MQNYITMRHPTARPGMIADNNNPIVKTGGVSQADIPFGLFIKGYNTHELLSAATDKVAGVAASFQDQPSNPDKTFSNLQLPYYAAGQSISVLTSGLIWVAVTEDVEPGDPVMTYYVASNGKPAGIAATTAVTDKTMAVTGAIFVSSAFSYVLSASGMIFQNWKASQTVTAIKIAQVQL